MQSTAADYMSYRIMLSRLVSAMQQLPGVQPQFTSILVSDLPYALYAGNVANQAQTIQTSIANLALLSPGIQVVNMQSIGVTAGNIFASFSPLVQSLIQRQGLGWSILPPLTPLVSAYPSVPSIPLYPSTASRSTSSAFPCADPATLIPTPGAALSNIANLQLHFVADSGLTCTSGCTTGNAVTAWQSNGANTASFALLGSTNPTYVTGTGTSSPNSIKFVGNDALSLSYANWISNPFTVCFTIRIDAADAANYDSIFGDNGATGTWGIALNVRSTKYGVSQVGIQLATSLIPVVLHQWHVVCTWSGGVQASTYNSNSLNTITNAMTIGLSVDNVLMAPAAVINSLVVNNIFRFGGPGATGSFHGQVRRIAMYNRVLTFGEREAVQFFMANDVGITLNSYYTTNPNHPYRFTQWTVNGTAVVAANSGGAPGFMTSPEPLYYNNTYYVYGSAYQTAGCSGQGYISLFTGSNLNTLSPSVNALSLSTGLNAAVVTKNYTAGTWDSSYTSGSGVFYDQGQSNLFYVYYFSHISAGSDGTCEPYQDLSVGVAYSSSPSGPFTHQTAPILTNTGLASSAWNFNNIYRACVIYVNGIYWLFVNGAGPGNGGTYEQVGMAWARSPLGPFTWSGYNPVMPVGPVIGPGVTDYTPDSGAVGDPHVHYLANINTFMAIVYTHFNENANSFFGGELLFSSDLISWAKAPITFGFTGLQGGFIMRPRITGPNLEYMLFDALGPGYFMANRMQFELPVCSFQP